MHPARPLLLALIASGATLLAACDDLDDEAPFPSGACEGPPAQVQGDWTVRGEGERRDCIDDAFNGSFDITTPVAVAVTLGQAEDGPVPFTGTPVEGEVPPGFRFDGDVQGPCVRLEYAETVLIRNQPESRRRLQMSFVGVAGDEGIVRGSFTGTGPLGCSTRGTFEALVD